MEDEEIALNNACADLVSLKKCEVFVLRLLTSQRPGDWIGVMDLCQQVGVGVEGLTAELYATWLPDPKSHAGYVVILFYDDESKWSMTARYNRARLVGGSSPNLALQPNGTARPVSSVPPAPQVAPAVEP